MAIIAAGNLRIRFETVEEYDDFCNYNGIRREDSKLEYLLTYATEAVYVEVVKRNRREYLKRWRDDYVKAIEEERLLKNQAARNRQQDARREAKELTLELNQFMQQMKREMEDKDGMSEERGRHKREKRLIGHIDEFLSRSEDPEMLREVSDPALTMWNEPKHPMFSNMARKLEDLGPVQPVELISGKTSMLHDGNMKSTSPAAKTHCVSNANTGSADSNCQRPPPGSASAAHTQSQQYIAAATVHLRPESTGQRQSQQDSAATVFQASPGSATAMLSCSASAAKIQQHNQPTCLESANAAPATTEVVHTGCATEPVSTRTLSSVVLVEPQSAELTLEKAPPQRTAVQIFTAALAYTLFGCFTCEPEPVMFEDASFEEDLCRSSMSFATNQKLMEFIAANHQLEYDRLRKRIAQARAKSLSKYQPS